MKRKKTWIIAVCAALVLAASVVGIIAYLTDSAGPVENTFIVGKLLDDPLNFILKEHKATDDDADGVYTLDTTEEVDGNTYDHVLPGVDLPKDPFVKTNETLKLDAYVFIEVVDEMGENLHFTVDDNNWTLLDEKTGPHGGKVYVMRDNDGIIEAGQTLGPIPILAKISDGKEITVDNARITDATAQFGGKVTFYGYMIQAGGFDDYDAAWAGFVGNGSGS